ncbi:EAL domain-containing protein [Zoogloea sp.]|uniref:EAL domain-containing protein n=1 Tax=Zoogloea sp. TaxID=49181 RepID=UPI00258345D0|nr:EAL domain-containing protein [Zoogloea sp.]MDD2667469.1 EAL domain-containing protein [Zoogloea sp.]
MNERHSRILAIDDTPANLLTLGAALSEEFDVQIATSGAQGLALAAKMPPDLILLDVMMPGMDGFETCRRLKADTRLKDIPVIFVTALNDIESEIQGLGLGAVDYITKPIQVSIARQRIRNLLEREQLRRQLMAQRDQLALEVAEHARTQVMLRKLTVAIEQGPATVVITDPDGTIQYVNPGFTAMTGYDATEVIGKNPRILQSGETSQNTYQNLWQHLEAGQAWQGELINKRKNGEHYWEESLIAPVTDASGAITHYVAVKSDVTKRKAAEETIKDANRQYQDLLSAASEFSIILTDKNGLIRIFNRGAERMLGYRADELIGKAVPAVLHVAAEVQQRGEALSAELGRPVAGFDVFIAKLDTEGQDRHEWTYVRKDGSHLTVALVVTEVYSATGEIVSYLGIAQDVTERKTADKKLQLAASVFTHAREGIMITDAEGTIIEVNDTFTRITGYQKEEVIGRNPRILKSGRHTPQDYAAMWKSLCEKKHWYGEVWNRRKNGEIFAEMQTISAVCDATGKTQHFVALFSDITPMKEHEQRLEHIAHYDALTQLPNRVLLADRLQRALLQSQRRNNSLAVVFLDLDSFKEVNDTHGHGVGDELLITVSQRMKSALREGDTLARIGGDEFVAVLVDLEQAEDCQRILERMLIAVSDPVISGETSLQVSASMGVTLYPQDGSDTDVLMRHADQAMYAAKQAGKNRYHLFDVAQDNAIKIQHDSLERIRLALSRHEFLLYYQPKVNMKSGEVIGAEALIRWQHPERGLLNPAEFLPITEDHPISIEIGEWVIGTALAQMSSWHARGLAVPVSVNIGARQLQQDCFATRLSQLLAEHPNVQPWSLQLEVLETSCLEDLGKVGAVMKACQAVGVDFTLDDFGTGYSSLSHLKHLPAATLKIDQSFVRDMLDDPNDLAIINGVIGLARAFGRSVIAEGVETAAHATLLISMGCEDAQGYGIARPMPATDLPAWISGWRHLGYVGKT